MFDAGHGGGSECVNGFEEEPGRSSRRQYTLKGIENETIELMRDAARKEGMKIGSWVSTRMKEAAERALASDTGIDAQDIRIPQDDSKDDVIQALAEYKLEADLRLTRMERELHEIANGQRAIMANLLTRA